MSMLSKINMSSSRALVFITDTTGKADPDFIVKRNKNQWEVLPFLGGAAVFTTPFIKSMRKIHPQTMKPYGKAVEQEVPLGMVLDALRRKLQGKGA